MTNLHDLLVRRRSIRRYTEQDLTPESVKLILEAALLSPTSKSSRAWHFVVVDNPATLEALSHCKAAGAMPVEKCRLAVVVAIDPANDDAWIEDASVAASNMLLQAADLGLGACWIQIRGRFTADGIPAEEYVREHLAIPDEYPVVCMVTFGHPAEERKPQNTDKLLWERVHIGTFKTAE